jgi:hypothetical protein
LPLKNIKKKEDQSQLGRLVANSERIKQAIEMHNECFDNDLEIILKENEND